MPFLLDDPYHSGSTTSSNMLNHESARHREGCCSDAMTLQELHLGCKAPKLMKFLHLQLQQLVVSLWYIIVNENSDMIFWYLYTFYFDVGMIFSGHDEMIQGFIVMPLVLVCMKRDGQDDPYWVTTRMITIYLNLCELDRCATNCAWITNQPREYNWFPDVFDRKRWVPPVPPGPKLCATPLASSTHSTWMCIQFIHHYTYYPLH